MNSLQKYVNFVKIEHSLFSLPLLFVGAYLAENKWPSFRLILLIVMAGAAARVVAMSLNRIFDRHIDSKNPRTQNREIPSGKMSLIQAWGVTILSLLIYLMCAWLISLLCLKLSWIPLVGFTVYPFFKRFTKWTHLGLGLVWSLVPLAGFIAVKPSLINFFPVAIISLFTVLWLAGFDIIYATADEEFDRQEGVYSLPAAWGSEKALRFSVYLHAISYLLLVILYFTWLKGILSVIFMGIIGVLFLMEHFFSDDANFSFFKVNVLIGFFVLFFIVFGV